MGLYINPPSYRKEAFLAKYGTPVYAKSVQDLLCNADELPVCLVDNGMFTAAGVGFDSDETQQWFDLRDGRPKHFFLVAKADLKDTSKSGITPHDWDNYVSE